MTNVTGSGTGSGDAIDITIGWCVVAHIIDGISSSMSNDGNEGRSSTTSVAGAMVSGGSVGVVGGVGPYGFRCPVLTGHTGTSYRAAADTYGIHSAMLIRSPIRPDVTVRG